MFILLHVCAFFTFFLTQVFATFHICASFFSFFSFFFIVLFLYLILYTYFFHRPQLYSSSRFIRHNYLLVCFNFHSSQSSRNVRLLSPHVPPYPSFPPPPLSSCYHVYFVHVGSVLLTSSLVKSQFSFRLMSSPLWSGANVCSPQSSHYKCSCKLEELPPSLADIITAFCRKPSMFESSLLPSTVWEWIKLSPRVHLRRESKMAAGQSTDSTESVPAILDVDDEKTLVKSFDETIIKKG